MSLNNKSYNNILPLEIINNKETLRLIYNNIDSLTSIPFYEIDENNEEYIIGQNKILLNDLVNPTKLKKEIKKINNIKKDLKHIVSVKNKLEKLSKGENKTNRTSFVSKKSFKGTGTSGNGIPPKTPGQENLLMRDINRSARKLYSFCSDTENEYQEKSIELSINSLVGWNNYNLGILPIGSIISISKNINYLLYLCNAENIYEHDKKHLKEELKINDFSKFKNIDESFYSKFIDVIIYNSSGNIDEDYYINNFNKIKNKKLYSLLKKDTIEIDGSPPVNFTNDSFENRVIASPDSDGYSNLTYLFNKSDETSQKNSIKYQIGFIFALFYNYIDQIVGLYEKIGKSTDNNNNNGINNISKMIKNTKDMFLLHIKACLINKYDINKKPDDIFVKKGKDHFEVKLNDDDFNIDEDLLNSKNFIIPIENDKLVFNNKDLKIKFMTNLVDFLSNPIKNTNIGCGALIQNGYVYNCSLKEIISFCAYLYKSKNLILKHLNNQLDFISKGVPINDIYKIYDFIYKNLERISRAPINIKEIICSDFIAQIKEKYENNRKRELKYTNEDYLYQIKNQNESNIRKINDEDYKILDTTRIHYGLLAEMIKLITPKVIEIFKDEKPTSRNGTKFDNLCDGLNTNILFVLSNVDESIKKELSKIIEKKQKNLGNKYLKKNNKNMLKLVSLNSIPKPSDDMYKKTMKLFNISGINGNISKGNSQIKNSSQFDFLSNDLLKKITTINFWQLILSSINGRTIFLPIYDSVYKNFYLFDVLNSLALSKIIIIKTINKNTILNQIVGKGYILLTDTVENLNNESKWKIINDENFTSKIKKKNVRLFLFNLIANDLIFNKNYNNYLSPKTNTSKLLRSFCKSIYKLQFSECSILISREQFGKGVQKLIKNITYLKGINFEKGNQYADIMHVISTKNNIFRK